MTSAERVPKITIVGGGLAGLYAAIVASEDGVRIDGSLKRAVAAPRKQLRCQPGTSLRGVAGIRDRARQMDGRWRR